MARRSSLPGFEDLRLLLQAEEGRGPPRESEGLYAMVERGEIPGVTKLGRRFASAGMLSKVAERFSAPLTSPLVWAGLTCYVGPAFMVARLPQGAEGNDREIRPYRKGGWEIDIMIRLDNGQKYRERRPPLPIEVTDEVLALTFADVDADGQDEIVTATATELVVYQAGGMAPTASAPQSGTVKDIVAGDFDAVPGEDVVLLIDEALVRYGCNGDGSFAMTMTTLPLLGSTERLLAAELDARPPTDLIGWGAFLEQAGQMSVFSNEQYQAGAVHDFNSPEPSLALRRGPVIDFHLLDGTVFALTNIVEGPPVLTAFVHGSAFEYLNLVHQSNWSLVQARDLSMSSHEWAVYGTPEQVVAGEIDGDGNDELVLFDGSIVALERDPDGPGDCWHELPAAGLGVPSQAVVGDYDGDGNEEFAIRTDLGELLVFDGG